MARSRSCFAYCEDPLPMKAGTSPYRIRGELYRLMHKRIHDVERQSAGALSRAFDDAGIAGFMSQPFVSSKFYDCLPLPRVVMCIAQVTGEDIATLSAELGRSGRTRELRGIYGKVVDDVTLSTLCTRLEEMNSFFHDFSPIETRAAFQEKRARAQRRAMPLCYADWWCLVSVPFVQIPLEEAGVQGLRSECRIVQNGMDGDVPLGDVTWDILWTDVGLGADRRAAQGRS